MLNQYQSRSILCLVRAKCLRYFIVALGHHVGEQRDSLLEGRNRPRAVACVNLESSMNNQPPDYQRIASDVKLGRDVRIYAFVNLYGCEIGDDTRIGTFVEIQKGAKVGANCKISSHTFICEGVTIESNVFVGHSVTFINDRFPRATNADGRPQTEADWDCQQTS